MSKPEPYEIEIEPEQVRAGDRLLEGENDYVYATAILDAEFDDDDETVTIMVRASRSRQLFPLYFNRGRNWSLRVRREWKMADQPKGAHDDW